MDKQTVAPPYHGLLFNDKKERAIQPYRSTDESYMHIGKWKKPAWEVEVLCDPIYMTFWKREIYSLLKNKQKTKNNKTTKQRLPD